MKIYVDFETDSLNMHFAQIIEGYFYREDGESYLMQACPKGEWNTEAEAIHGISYERAQSFDKPEIALAKVLKWLPMKFTLCCWANINHYYKGAYTFCPYDYGVLASNIMWHLGWNEFNKFRVNVKWQSIHQKAKEQLRLKSYKQENVARQFGIEYNAHNAKDDVMAMVAIDKKLDDILII